MIDKLKKFANADMLPDFDKDPSIAETRKEKLAQVASYSDETKLLLKSGFGKYYILSAGEIRRELSENFSVKNRLFKDFGVIDDADPVGQMEQIQRDRDRELLRYDTLPEKFAAECGLGLLDPNDVVIYLEGIKYEQGPLQCTVKEYHDMFNLNRWKEISAQHGTDELYQMLEDLSADGGIKILSVGQRRGNEDGVAEELAREFYEKRARRRADALDKAVRWANYRSELLVAIEQLPGETVTVVFPDDGKLLTVPKMNVRYLITANNLMDRGVPTINGQNMIANTIE